MQNQRIKVGRSRISFQQPYLNYMLLVVMICIQWLAPSQSLASNETIAANPWSDMPSPISEKDQDDFFAHYKATLKSTGAKSDTNCNVLNGDCIIDTYSTTWTSGNCPPTLNSITINEGARLIIENCTVDVTENVYVVGELEMHDGSSYIPKLYVGSGSSGGIMVMGTEESEAKVTLRGADIKVNTLIWIVANASLVATNSDYENATRLYHKDTDSWTGIVNWGGSLSLAAPTTIEIFNVTIEDAEYGVDSRRYESGLWREVDTELQVDGGWMRDVKYGFIGYLINSDSTIIWEYTRLDNDDADFRGRYAYLLDCVAPGVLIADLTDYDSSLLTYYIPILLDDIEGDVEVKNCALFQSALYESSPNRNLVVLSDIDGNVEVSGNYFETNYYMDQAISISIDNTDYNLDVTVSANEISYSDDAYIPNYGIVVNASSADVVVAYNEVTAIYEGIHVDLAYLNSTTASQATINNNDVVMKFPTAAQSKCYTDFGLGACSGYWVGSGKNLQMHHNELRVLSTHLYAFGYYLEDLYAYNLFNSSGIYSNESYVEGDYIRFTGIEYGILPRTCGSLSYTYHYDNTNTTSGFDVFLETYGMGCTSNDLYVGKQPVSTVNCDTFYNDPPAFYETGDANVMEYSVCGW